MASSDRAECIVRVIHVLVRVHILVLLAPINQGFA